MRQFDLIEEYSSIAYHLTDTMYIDGKSSKGKKELTKDELWDLLESTRTRCFDNYKEGAKELGWID